MAKTVTLDPFSHSFLRRCYESNTSPEDATCMLLKAAAERAKQAGVVDRVSHEVFFEEGRRAAAAMLTEEPLAPL